MRETIPYCDCCGRLQVLQLRSDQTKLLRKYFPSVISIIAILDPYYRKSRNRYVNLDMILFTDYLPALILLQTILLILGSNDKSE